MNFLNLKIGKYLLLALFIGGSLWYFLQTDEKYLKKKTKMFISLASFSSPVPQIQAARRVSKISELLRFDVYMEVKVQKKIYKTKNLQQIKSFLLPYFLEAQTAQWKEENLKVKIDEKKKEALVSLLIKGNYDETTLQCQMNVQWLKEENWLIQNIKVFQCLSSGTL